MSTTREELVEQWDHEEGIRRDDYRMFLSEQVVVKVVEEHYDVSGLKSFSVRRLDNGRTFKVTSQSLGRWLNPLEVIAEMGE